MHQNLVFVRFQTTGINFESMWRMNKTHSTNNTAGFEIGLKPENMEVRK